MVVVDYGSDARPVMVLHVIYKRIYMDFVSMSMQVAKLSALQTKILI